MQNIKFQLQRSNMRAFANPKSKKFKVLIAIIAVILVIIFIIYFSTYLLYLVNMYAIRFLIKVCHIFKQYSHFW